MDVIKVASLSRTASVAGAIAGVYRENEYAEVQAIGAGAVNQAVKAVIIAKRYLAEEGKHILFTPSFVEVEIEGKVRTAVRLSVEGNSHEISPDSLPKDKTAVIDTMEIRKIPTNLPLSQALMAWEDDGGTS
jgi:stage V sporulation protein S